MSELYRDFIDRKADQIITDLGGTITPTNAELYRDFLGRKFDDVITAINGSITPAPAGDELYRDFIERKFDDVITGIGGYVPPVSFPTVSGSICSFNSAVAGLPLKSHTVALTATQSGSGTPSPDNVRTINGYSAINISATGKNLLDTSSISGTFAGVTYTNANGIVTINGTKLGSTFASFTNARVSMRAGISYTFSINLLSGTIRDANQNLRNLQCYLISTNDVNMGSIVMYDTETIKSITVTPEEDIVVYPRFAWWSDNTIVTDLQLQMQIERNNVPTDYQPFGTYTTINIGQTVNEATYNARTGVLEVTQPSVQTIQLAPCPIDVLEGQNNIWADTGDTTLQYIKIGGNT